MTPLKGFVIAAVLAATGFAAYAQARPDGHGRDLTVMTRNLYLGTDLKPILTGPSAPELFAAVGTGWAQAQANDFPARAQALADEIAASKPDLVGLQEAMLFRTDSPPDGPASPAETLEADFLDLLVGALADRGLRYKAASVYTGTDAELPAGLPPTQDVRLTDRVVVLARVGGSTRLQLSNPRSGAYTTTFSVPTVVGPITLPRGWASVDAKVDGAAIRFVTTHLEAFAGPIRNAQATELVAGPATGMKRVIVVGDMNSGPGGDPAAYSILTGSGLVDSWSNRDGYTCCHAVDLSNPDPTLTKRIDLVLTKGGFRTLKADVVGNESTEWTPGGLWPSDHAGLVVRLRVPKS